MQEKGSMTKEFIFNVNLMQIDCSAVKVEERLRLKW